MTKQRNVSSVALIHSKLVFNYINVYVQNHCVVVLTQTKTPFFVKEMCHRFRQIFVVFINININLPQNLHFRLQKNIIYDIYIVHIPLPVRLIILFDLLHVFGIIIRCFICITTDKSDDTIPYQTHKSLSTNQPTIISAWPL